MSTDPLLKAVAEGDPHCPDGVALARLGRLVRNLPTPTANLAARVRAARPAVESAEDDDALPLALSQRIAALAPVPVDLRPRVLARLRTTPSRFDPQRLRVWLWVGVGHVAALVLVAVLATSSRPEVSGEQMVGGWSPARSAPAELPGPRDWTGLPVKAVDLVADRRDPATRDSLRRRYGSTRSAGTVTCALGWLRDRQAALLAQPVTETTLATRAMVALALVGEGDDTAARTLLADAVPEGAVTRALQALALVEVALVSRASEDAELARLALLRLTIDDHGPGGLGGYALLAIEEARAGGLAVPPRQVAAVRAGLGRPLPSEASDPGRIGLAALARVWCGYRDNPSTALLVGRLDQQRPTTVADPLGWWFPTLALRDASGVSWDRWNADLQTNLLANFRDAGPGRAFMPVAAARHAPNDEFATAASVLCLQAAYHTLPLGL